MLVQTPAEPDDEMSTFKARAFRKPDDPQFLVDIIEDIKDGTFAEEVEKVRSQEKGSQAHKAAKKALGSFTVSGVFRKRREGFPDTHTGLIQADFDGKDHPGLKPADMRARVIDHPSLVACFVSPSGDGLKAIFKVGVATGEADHKHRFESVKAEMARLGLTVDDNCKDPARLCFYSHDPEALYRLPQEAEAIPLLPKSPEAPPKRHWEEEGISHPLPVARRALEAIKEEIGRPEYPLWLGLTAGMGNSYGSEGIEIMKDVFPEENEGEYEDKLPYLPKAHNAGYVLNQAKELAGWEASRKEKAALRERLKESSMETARAAPKIFYDGTRYYLDNKKEFIPINEASTKRHLRKAGAGRDEIEAALCEIQTQNFIVFAGPLAGKTRGIHETNGQKVLAINSPNIIQAKQGEFPTLKAVIEGLLGHDPKQIPIFHGWMKVAREGLLSGKRSWGQVLALAGEAGCGKSLLIDLLERLLGGRRANPYKFFTARTGFNADLAGAELLAVDDDAGSTDIRARKALGAAIKANLFAGKVSVEGKHKTPFSFAPFWRMVMALNDEPEELLLLPPITEDIADKITLLKCQRFEFPKRAETQNEKARFFEQLVSEMPGYLHFLEQWEIPEELRERRCGVIHYHEPSLMESLGALSPEATLQDLIRRAHECDSLPYPWEGTASELRTILCSWESTRKDAEKLLGTWIPATGTFLGRLCGKGVQKLPLYNGIQRWRIT